MKNLKVIKTRPCQLKEPTWGFCVDADNNATYVIGQGFQVFKVVAHHETETISHDLDISPEISNTTLNDVRLIEFIVESSSIFIALKSGHLIRIGVSAHSPASGCLFKHHSELTSVKLSPDQDLIAIADSSNNLYTLDLDGTLLRESNALTQNESLHKPVGVGWGSKETQFFGLDGRPSKEKQLEEKATVPSADVETIEMIESSDIHRQFRLRRERNTVIDWRGDGQYLATLTYITDLHKHYLKVWNRNLELQYMSDQLVTVERDMLTWVPNGQFVCCAQRRERQINEIAMFEKNGLVHQRITLPTNLSNLYIKDILWSPNSKILTVIANQFFIKDNQIHFTSLLLLYTMQNFHYYLKFTTKLFEDVDYTARWNPVKHDKLYVMSSGGHYCEFNCIFEVTHSNQMQTVAVIDSNKVLVTPLQMCNMPPPLSAFTLEVGSPIQSIALHTQTALTLPDIFIITYDDKLIHVKSGPDNACDNEDELKVQLNINLPSEKLSGSVSKIDEVHKFQNFTPIDGSSLVATRDTDCSATTGSEVVVLSVPDIPNKSVDVKTITTSDELVVSIARRAAGSALIITESGLVADPYSNLDSPLHQSKGTTLINAIQLQILESGGATFLLSLHQDLDLTLNNTLLSTSCTSFRVTENYLIYTTTENLMHFSLLDRVFDKMTNESSTDPMETYMQPIEVGATLIVASEADAKVVLQMPRGNLEIIHPRVLIFSTLTLMLSRREFIAAIQLARRHRVNMNFICDYILRLEGRAEVIIKEFSRAVAEHNAQLLTLFVTELDDEDTIWGRYESIMEHLLQRETLLRQPAQLGKVQLVCTSIELPEEYRFLQPKLLCLLKQTPRQTCEALRLIHKLEKESQREALKFMLYFLDIDQLFLDALCTYNTDITLMVASVSHKDPKEYLALLDEFNSEENALLRASKIDMHVKHFGDAFAKLLQHHNNQDIEPQNLETHNQLKDIVVSKRIYKQALSCFTSSTKDKKLFEELWADYGSYLLEKRCYLEAGLSYSKALELRSDELDYLNKALRCFSLANRSENSLALIPKLGNQDQIVDVVVGHLLEEDKCLDSLAFYLTSKFKSSGIQIDQSSEVMGKLKKKLMDKGNWYIVEFAYPDSTGCPIRDTIKESVLDSTRSQIETWTDELKLKREQFERLKELLKTYKSRAIDEENRHPTYISDSLSTVDGSEVSSTMSGLDCPQRPARSGASSIKTRNSSKSNKSQVQKKKRINTKPGSRHEDLALALELRNFVSRQKSDQDEGMRLSAALFEYCYSTALPEDETARIETKRINDVLSEQFDIRHDILSSFWPDSPNNEQMYSLYRRFSKTLSDEECTHDNEEFEVLIKPILSKNRPRFDL